jgi:hypothetical protein
MLDSVAETDSLDLDQLCALFDTQAPEDAFAALAAALGRSADANHVWGGEVTERLVLAMLGHDNEMTRRWACDLAAEWSTDAALPELLRIVDDSLEDGVLRADAFDAVFRLLRPLLIDWLSRRPTSFHKSYFSGVVAAYAYSLLDGHPLPDLQAIHDYDVELFIRAVDAILECAEPYDADVAIDAVRSLATENDAVRSTVAIYLPELLSNRD